MRAGSHRSVRCLRADVWSGLAQCLYPKGELYVHCCKSQASACMLTALSLHASPGCCPRGRRCATSATTRCAFTLPTSLLLTKHGTCTTWPGKEGAGQASLGSTGRCLQKDWKRFSGWPRMGTCSARLPVGSGSLSQQCLSGCRGACVRRQGEYRYATTMPDARRIPHGPRRLAEDFWPRRTTASHVVRASKPWSATTRGRVVRRDQKSSAGTRRPQRQQDAQSYDVVGSLRPGPSLGCDNGSPRCTTTAVVVAVVAHCQAE